MQVQPYLDFGGRFDEAVAFYGKAVGATVTFVMRYKDAPPDQPVDPAWREKVMHANIQIGETQIMASDGRPGIPAPAFSGFSLSVGAVSEAEGARIFQALSEGGQVVLPYQKTFWAAGFGMLVDRFGMSWMVNCEH